MFLCNIVANLLPAMDEEKEGEDDDDDDDDDDDALFYGVITESIAGTRV